MDVQAPDLGLEMDRLVDYNNEDNLLPNMMNDVAEKSAIAAPKDTNKIAETQSGKQH